jgi:hypothetical protein
MHLIGRATTRVRSLRPDQGRAIRELLIVASILSALPDFDRQTALPGTE